MPLVNEIVKYYDSLSQQYHESSGYDKETSLATYREIKELIDKLFINRNVLEIACGTGYWTEILSQSASSVLATDLNASMITKAKGLYSSTNIEFRVADAYSLNTIPNHFSGAFSVLFWCHIPKSKIHQFLNTLHSKLAPNSPVLIICQLEDQDSMNHAIDSEGNTIALRKADSQTYNIVKNIPSEKELTELLAPHAKNILYSRYPDYGLWSVSYSI